MQHLVILEVLVKPRILLLLLLAALLVALSPFIVHAADLAEKLVQPQGADWSQNGLKALLSTPLALLVVMLIASTVNGIKQLNTAKKSGSDMTFATYLSYMPDTAATLLGNVIAFAALILSDQLNFASALGIGYGINSLTDLLPGKRSDALAASTDPTDSPSDVRAARQNGFATGPFLALLMGLGLIGLSVASCTTTPTAVLTVACDTGQKNYAIERCAKSIGETWEVYQKRAADVVTAVTTPQDVKEAVKAAEAASREPVLDLLRAAQLYRTAKQQLAAGQTQSDQLAIANQNLAQWIATALPLVQHFGNSLGL